MQRHRSTLLLLATLALCSAIGLGALTRFGSAEEPDIPGPERPAGPGDGPGTSVAELAGPEPLVDPEAHGVEAHGLPPTSPGERTGAGAAGRVRVRAVHEDGSPAVGVELKLHALRLSPSGMDPLAALEAGLLDADDVIVDQELTRVRTGEQGRAVLELGPYASPDFVGTVRVRPTMLLAPESFETCKLDLDVARLTDVEHELVVPASGGVRVVLVGEDGRPWARAQTLALDLLSEGGESGGDLGGTWYPVRDGELLLEPIEVGRRLRLRLAADLGSRIERVIDGPARAGEVAEHRVEVLALRTLLHARLLRADGSVLTSNPVSFRGEFELGGSLVLFSESTRTDGEGRMEILVDPTRNSTRMRSLRVTDTLALGEGTRPFADLPLPDPLPTGVVQLGDVRLQIPSPPATLVSGSVVRASGEPVVGALVQLVEAGSTRWVPGEGPRSLRTAQDGTFTLEGRLPDGERELLVEGGLDGRARLSVHVGDVVRVVLAAPGEIHGSVLLEPDLPCEELTVIALPAGEDADPSREQERTNPEGDGAFVLAGLAPGTYDVELGLRGSRVPLRRVPGVEVLGGGVQRDPRLSGIDLRGTLRLQRVVLRFPEGDAPRGGRCAWSVADGEDPPNWFDYTGDRVVQLVPRGPVDLCLRPKGQVPVDRTDVSGDLVVDLPAPRSVRLRLVPEGPLPRDGSTLVPCLNVAAEGGRRVWHAADALHGLQEYRIPALPICELELEWTVQRSFAGGGIASSRSPLTPQTFHVLPGEGEQLVELRVSAEELEWVQRDR